MEWDPWEKRGWNREKMKGGEEASKNANTVWNS